MIPNGTGDSGAQQPAKNMRGHNHTKNFHAKNDFKRHRGQWRTEPAKNMRGHNSQQKFPMRKMISNGTGDNG